MGNIAADIAREIRQDFAATPGKIPGGLRVSDSYTKTNTSANGIRPNHAIAAAERATAVDTYEIGAGKTIALALAPVAVARYTMLLMLDGDTAGALIHFAWRLYDTQVTPTDAFAEFVERYGYVVTLDDRSDKFITQAVVPWPGPGPEISAPSANDVVVNAFMYPTGGGRAHYAWVFAIDPGAYLADVAAQR